MENKANGEVSENNKDAELTVDAQDKLRSLSRVRKIERMVQRTLKKAERRGLHATVSVGLVTLFIGVLVNLYITKYSTEQITEAMFPHNFAVSPLGNGNWYEVEKEHEIKVEGNIIPLKPRIWNKSKFPVRGLFVTINFRSDQILESVEPILELYSKADGISVYRGKPHSKFKEFDQSFSVYDDYLGVNASRILLKSKLTLKGDSGTILLQINATENFTFKFVLKK